MKPDSDRIFGLDFSHDPVAAAVASLCDGLERELERRRFAIFEEALSERLTHIGEVHLKEYLAFSRFHPDYPELALIKSISMLHIDVLMLLRLFARASRAPVLEIGPYVGGSTIAIGRGLRAAGLGLPLLSVEAGGSYADHPHVPSRDIIADLTRNVEAAGLASLVHVINGHSRDKAVAEEVRTRLGGRTLGMLVIDADGEVAQDWSLYGELLGPDAIVVLDDYVSDWAADKALQVKPWADSMVAENVLRPLGVYGWGTWFGQKKN